MWCFDKKKYKSHSQKKWNRKKIKKTIKMPHLCFMKYLLLISAGFKGPCYFANRGGFLRITVKNVAKNIGRSQKFLTRGYNLEVDNGTSSFIINVTSIS